MHRLRHRVSGEGVLPALSCALALVLAALAVPVPARAEGEPPAPELVGVASVGGLPTDFSGEDVRWFMTDDGAHVVVSVPTDEYAEVSPSHTTSLYVCDTSSASVSQVSAWDPNDGVALPISNDRFLIFSGGQLSTYDYADGTVTPLEGLDAHATVLGCALAPDGHSLRIVFADHGPYVDSGNKLTYAPTVYDLNTHQVTAQIKSPEYSFLIQDEQGWDTPSTLPYSAPGGWVTDDLSTFIVIGDGSVDAYSMSSGNEVYQTPFDYSETSTLNINSADGIVGDSCHFGGQVGNTLLVHDSYYNHRRTYRLDVTTGKLSPLSQNSYMSLTDPSDSTTTPLVSVVLYAPSASSDENFYHEYDQAYVNASGTLKIAAIDSETGDTLWESDLDASTIASIEPFDFDASSDGRYCYAYFTEGVYGGGDQRSLMVVDTQTGAVATTDVGDASDGSTTGDTHRSSLRHVRLTPDATRLVLLETMMAPDDGDRSVRVNVFDTGVTLQMPTGVMAADEGQAGGGPGPVPVLPIALGAVAVVAAAGAVTIVVLRRRSGRRRAAATPSPAPGGGPVPRALFCPHCGARQPTTEARFCKYCGKPIR